MKYINPVVHGLLDFAMVILFAAAPSLFHLTGLGSALSYILAIVHLVLTLSTAFAVGMFKAVPLVVHGVIELIVALALIALGLAVFGAEPISRAFYIIVGILLFVIWLLSNYRGEKAVTPTTSTPV